MAASPQEFRSAAAAIRAAGRQIEDDRGRLRRYGSLFDEWLSPAADHFNSFQYEASFQQYDLVTSDMHDLAAMLDDAAQKLESKLAEIRGKARRIRGFFRSPPAWTVDIENPDPIWVRQGWRYQPWNLPADDSDPRWSTIYNHFVGTYGITP